MKAHLVSNAEPVPDGCKILTLCGAEIESAIQVFMWDEQQMESEPLLSRIYTCGNCIDRSRQEHLANKARRYLYGVVRGEMER